MKDPCGCCVVLMWLGRHVLLMRECEPLTGAAIQAPETTAVRYERERPGELVRVDVKKIGKIPAGMA